MLSYNKLVLVDSNGEEQLRCSMMARVLVMVNTHYTDVAIIVIAIIVIDSIKL